MTMSRVDDLPPDQRAALSLLLRQRKSYAEVATLLKIPERAVHDRAQAALATLLNGSSTGGRTGELSAERRVEIGDYLLRQQTGVAERRRTRAYLESSAPGRAWAQALSAELAPLAADPLPEIPAGPGPMAPAGRDGDDEPQPGQASTASSPGARAARSLPTSRTGGALLLGVIAAAVIAAVILISSAGAGSHASATKAGSSSKGTTSTATAPSSSTTSTTAGGPTEEARLALTSPDPTSKTVGVAAILAEGHQRAFYLAAERLPPSKGFFYAVWLYNSPKSFLPLGKSPPVGANGRMQGGALLPSNAGDYRRMIVTRETSERPSHPGPIVLSGTFKLGG
jgi:Sigma-70, region 4